MFSGIVSPGNEGSKMPSRKEKPCSFEVWQNCKKESAALLEKSETFLGIFGQLMCPIFIRNVLEI